jgi:hypothetical protein
MFESLGPFLASLGMNSGMADQLDALGVPVPDMSKMMSLGGAMPPAGGPGIPDLGSIIGGAEGGGQAAGVAGAAPGGLGQMAKAGLSAVGPMVKAPEVPKPIMSGGVAGGVRAPDIQKVQAGSPAIASLMQALLGGRGGGMPVPDLGSYIRGGKY